jgi:hypothetical protein
MYVTAAHVGAGGSNITLPHLQALYAGGWALGNHAYHHTDLTAVDQATAATEIGACTAWLIAHGFPRAAYHMAYPYNNSSAGARAAAAECGILTARRHGYRNQHMPVDEPLMLNSFGFEDATMTIEAWREKVDRAIACGGTLIFYGHSFTTDQVPLFQAIADYVAARRVWAPGIDGWWDTLAQQSQSGEASAGGYLYVTCDAGLQVVDIADPLTPVLAGACVAGGADDVAACDGGACIASGAAGLQVVDVHDPAAPAVIGSSGDGSTHSGGVCVLGSTAYVAAGADGLRIVSIADPAHPQLLGVADTQGDARDVVVDGGTAYVADGPAGIVVVDVSDPAHPVPVSNYPLSTAAEALVVFGQTAYVASGDGGLRVVAL